MRFRLKRILPILVLVLISLMISCDENEPQEIDINVLSTKTEVRSKPGESEITKFGIIEYNAKNTSTKTINGWKVFFNVHIYHGPQMTAYESIYYSLEPGEESKTRTVECIIPDYYEDAYKATLKYVETW